MNIHFVLASTRFTGGRQEMLRHADGLALRGHAVTLWCQDAAPRIDWYDLRLPLLPLPAGGFRQLPRADVCVFDRTRLAEPLLRANRGTVAHLCQGFEGTGLDDKLTQLRSERGLLRSLPSLLHTWARRREIDRAYALPTRKIATHRPLVDLIARRYRQAAHFVPYGLPPGVFTPPEQRTFAGQTILLVGPTDTGWKRIADALHAVKLLKARNPKIRLLRAAQHPQRPAEAALNVTDEYHTMLTPAAMAALYRRADLLIQPSDATEGFGLPALEAMACGLPCLLTDIPAFRTFSPAGDHAYFVPVAQPAVLAFAAARLLDDVPGRQRLSRRGLEVAATYDVHRSRAAMAATLEQLAA